MAERRVVVTGVGAVTPLGLDVETTWEAVLQGKSGVDLIKSFDTEGFPSRMAAEIKGFTASDWLPARDANLSDPFMHFAIASAKMALDSSRLLEDPSRGERTGTCMGTGSGGLQVMMTQSRKIFEKGPRYVSPFGIPFTICDMASGYVSMQHKLLGPNHCIVSACASGASAIGEAYHMIKRGSVEAMVAGGSEGLTLLNSAAFASARALSTRNGDPKAASRPFDLERDGFVLGEGGAALVLEEFEQAKGRDAPIIGELIGYGSTADAYHITSPDPTGQGSIRAMKEAMSMGSVSPHDVGYVNAHATSTAVGDRLEVAALRQVFGKRLETLPVSSTKSMTGHMIGAAGAIEAIFSLLAMRDEVLPPTINQTSPDPDCDIDTVPNQSRKASPAVVMTNSFGFGGHNVSLVFRKF